MSIGGTLLMLLSIAWGKLGWGIIGGTLLMLSIEWGKLGVERHWGYLVDVAVYRVG